MDPSLVEKVTRLVLAKLAEYAEAQPSSDKYPPLSEEEIKRWNRLTASMQQTMTAKPALQEQFAYPPLTADELNTWRDITAALEAAIATKQSAREGEQGTGMATFYRI